MTCFSCKVEKKYASTSAIKNVSENRIFSPLFENYFHLISFVIIFSPHLLSISHEEHIIRQIKAWSFQMWKNLGHTKCKFRCNSALKFDYLFLTPCIYRFRSVALFTCFLEGKQYFYCDGVIYIAWYIVIYMTPSQHSITCYSNKGPQPHFFTVWYMIIFFMGRFNSLVLSERCLRELLWWALLKPSNLHLPVKGIYMKAGLACLARPPGKQYHAV